MPSFWRWSSARTRTWDSPVHPDVELRSRFFDPNAIADVPFNPVNTPVEATPHQTAAGQQASGGSLFASASVPTRAKSLPIARYRWEQSPLRASFFQQRPFEPILDDFETTFSDSPTTPASVPAEVIEQRAERLRATAEHRIGSILTPASAIELESLYTEPPLSPNSTLVDASPIASEQSATRSAPACSPIMASLNPSSAYRLTGQRSVTQEQAKEQQKIIEQKLSRANQPSPPYDFVDLIGKGSFGRVYLG